MRIVLTSVVATAAITLSACSSEPDQLAFDDEVGASTSTPSPTVDVEIAPDPADGLSDVAVPADGELTVAITPGAPVPDVPGAEAITEVGDGDGSVGTDGVAGIVYVMTDWEGNVVERSDDIAPVLPIVVGEPAATPPRVYSVPAALADALVGREVGTRVKVTFPVGMDDLPRHLDATQAYALAVDIVWYQEA